MILKCWFIEEVALDGESAGKIGQRQTVMEFDSETGDWIRPDDRLEPGATTDWEDIMKTIGGEKDLSWLVNPVALMDYCNNKALARKRRERGKGDAFRTKEIAPTKVQDPIDPRKS